ncbi:heptaprenyl diphosphate synthase component 1 [Staphylospora marina]|uniref:heptaprenyl diphosphate synthase component 1 n=1 Tax=Staphylospora marina TaxID=2490858 RepID=UPI000F5BD222|nr:heptaprenyl diphosphate synthase component 1 [Staphylospora marina]
MELIHTDDELRSVLDEVRRASAHPYLDRMVGNPVIPVFFVRVMVRMMQSMGVDRDRLRQYAVASTLLKMGLDVHERIPVQSEPSSGREQQLLVLAGDYYSSLFYRMLSAHGEVEGVRCLSQAICQINEWKTIRHLSESDGELSQMDRLLLEGKIESGILAALADFFHVGNHSDNPWKDLGLELMMLDLIDRSKTGFARESGLDRLTDERMDRILPLLERVHPDDVRRDLMELATKRQDRIRARCSGKGSDGT